MVTAAAVCLLGGLLAAVLILPPGRGTGLRHRLVRRFEGRTHGDESTPRARPVGRRLWRASLIGFTAGLAFHLGSVLLTSLLVRAVDPGAISLQAVSAVAVARLSLAVPISPSGLGFQEGALSVLFVGIGLSPETALAALLLGRISLLATTLIGAAALALDRQGSVLLVDGAFRRASGGAAEGPS
jgi:uncharacterized membrane protein YbhN (UPF0104 family)